jgi:hypothetical protein
LRGRLAVACLLAVVTIIASTGCTSEQSDTTASVPTGRPTVPESAGTQSPSVSTSCSKLTRFSSVAPLHGDVAVAPASECSVFVAETDTNGALEVLQIDADGHSQVQHTLRQLRWALHLAATPAGLWIDGRSPTETPLLTFQPRGAGEPRSTGLPIAESIIALAPYQDGALVVVYTSGGGGSHVLRLGPHGSSTRLMSTSAELTAVASQGETYYLGGHRDYHGLLLTCHAGDCIRQALPDTVSIVTEIVPLPNGIAVTGHTLEAGEAPTAERILFQQTNHRSWTDDTPDQVGELRHIAAVDGRLYAITSSGNPPRERVTLIKGSPPASTWQTIYPAPLGIASAGLDLVSTGPLLWVIGESLYRVAPQGQ